MPRKDPAAFLEARTIKEKALAKLRVLQAQKLDGQLLDASEVRLQWQQAFAALRDRGLGMADRIVQRGAMRPAGELRRIVDSEVRDLLEAVARGDILG